MHPTRKVVVHPDSNTGIYVWNADVDMPDRNIEWCFWENFATRIEQMTDSSVTALTLFNPTGSMLELILLTQHTPPTRQIPTEMAHCLLNLFANDSDIGFYGNPHLMLLAGDALQLPSGVLLHRENGNILYVNLISSRPDRSDFMLLRKEVGVEK